MNAKLIEFLWARLEEDEASAHLWRSETEALPHPFLGIDLAPGWKTALDECAAKRTLLEMFAIFDEMPAPMPVTERSLGQKQGLEMALHALVLGYASHPNYDESLRA